MRGNKLSKGPGDCHALKDFRVQCPLACQNIHLKAKNNSCSSLAFLHFLLIKKKQRLVGFNRFWKQNTFVEYRHGLDSRNKNQQTVTRLHPGPVPTLNHKLSWRLWVNQPSTTQPYSLHSPAELSHFHQIRVPRTWWHVGMLSCLKQIVLMQQWLCFSKWLCW